MTTGCALSFKCLSCGQVISEDDARCPVCQVSVHHRLIREIWLFLLFLGCGTLTLAWVIRMNPGGNPTEVRPLIWIGLGVAGFFLASCGAAFAITRRSTFAYLGTGGAVLAFLAALIFLAASSANDRPEGIVKLIAIPALAVTLICHRTWKLRFVKLKP
jgi:hypothetical protein